MTVRYIIKAGAVNESDLVGLRPGNVIRVEEEATAMPLVSVGFNEWISCDERSNCENCGAPVYEAVCGYCGTRHA